MSSKDNYSSEVSALKAEVFALKAKLAETDHIDSDEPNDEYPDFKTENFDFHELTAGLSNSLTDKIYRGYHQSLSNKYEQLDQKDRDSQAHGARNDLEVDVIAKNIRKKTEEKLVEEASDLMVKRVIKDLREQYHVEAGTTERFFDDAIKGMRWLMVVPFLCVSLVMLSYVFVMFAETAHMSKNSYGFVKDVRKVVFTDFCINHKEDAACKDDGIKKSLNKVVASVLLVLDLLLVGSLVIIVLVGGYENTISRIGISHGVPTWFGKFDISQLKLKVAASIIIISSIQLLMSFMQIEMNPDGKIDVVALKWTAIVHGIFVLSGIGLAIMDLIHHLGDSQHN